MTVTRVPSRVRPASIVIDCGDLERMGLFWGALLGMRIADGDYSEDWLELEPLGSDGPVLSFQRASEPKAGKNRLHLDLEVTDLHAAGEFARAIGATPASRVRDNYQVWRDPEGNEFCFVLRSSEAASDATMTRK